MVLAVPSQRTWTVSDLETAALFNSNIRDAVTFLANPPLFRGYAAATQTLTTATTTAIALDTNTVDTYNGHSTVTNNTRYTAQVAGTYLVIGRVSYAFNATGSRCATIRVNGVVDVQSQVRAMAVTVTDPTTVMTCVQEQLSVGDYVEVVGFQRSGGNLATAANESTLEVTWLHA